MKQKIDPKIFRDAAILILENHSNYCCFAISRVLNLPSLYTGSRYHKYFVKYFKSKKEIKGSPAGWFGIPSKKNRQTRVLALLLCADILEQENKKK